VDFLHKSFLDYFLAQYFISQSDCMDEKEHNQIYSLYYSTLWEDVTFFYFGIKRKITKNQIDKIIKNSPVLQSEGLEQNKQLQLIDSLSKFQLGKLMQYAWHTSDDNKKYALSISTNESIELKKKMITFHKDNLDMDLPSIVSDASMLHFVELTHTSIFIEKPIGEIINETMHELENCTKEDFEKNIEFQSVFYFSSLYVIVNAGKMPTKTLKHFMKTLIKNDDKIPTQLSLPIFGLFSLFKKKKNILNDENIDEADIKNIDTIHKKLRKKNLALSNEIFTFKSKADLARIQALKNRK